MSRFKKSLLWLLACVVLILIIFSILQKQGYFEDPALALRELESLGIEATDAEARKAIQANDFVLLQRLGRAGVDFAKPNESGRSLLHLAMAEDRTKMLPLLDRYGIQVNQPDGTGRLPLEEALDKEEPVWAEALVKRGAEIDFSIGEKPAAIIYYESKRWDDLSFLIDHGTPPNPVDQNGVSLMARIIKAGDAHWLERILTAGAQVTGADQALAAEALEMKRADLVLPLLKSGTDPNHPSQTEGAGNRRLIHRLCQDWHTIGYTEPEAAAILQELITQGADLEIASPEGLRPIQATIKFPFHAGQDLLTPRVKDISACLGLAIAQQDWHAMQTLLNRGTNPDEIVAGETALFTMIKAGQVAMVHSLITHGASLEVLGAEGQRPLVTALATENEELILTLLNHERKPELSAHMEFPVSPEFRDLYGRKGLLDWYSRNERHMQPIMVAVMLRELKVVERLIELGVDKTSRTKSGVYPIQMAAKRGDVKMQQLLIGVPYEDDQQERHFIIDLSDQKVFHFQGEKLIKSSRCSSGSSDYRTPPGKYVITDRTKNKVSNLYRDAKMPYFQRFSCSEIGFHEGATHSGFLSHGCIRVPMSTAKYLWANAKLGDRVTIRK